MELLAVQCGLCFLFGEHVFGWLCAGLRLFVPRLRQSRGALLLEMLRGESLVRVAGRTLRCFPTLILRDTGRQFRRDSFVYECLPQDDVRF